MLYALFATTQHAKPLPYPKTTLMHLAHVGNLNMVCVCSNPASSRPADAHNITLAVSSPPATQSSQFVIRNSHLADLPLPSSKLRYVHVQ
jgi:hypothetical protein